MKMSYMVGFGPHYPRRIHHRGSSLPSFAVHPQSFGCDDGYQSFFYSGNPNPNILVGAIVGGPNQSDGFADDRTDYSESEPATYINAAAVGPLAYFAGIYDKMAYLHLHLHLHPQLLRVMRNCDLLSWAISAVNFSDLVISSSNCSVTDSNSTVAIFVFISSSL